MAMQLLLYTHSSINPYIRISAMTKENSDKEKTLEIVEAQRIGLTRQSLTHSGWGNQKQSLRLIYYLIMALFNMNASCHHQRAASTEFIELYIQIQSRRLEL